MPRTHPRDSDAPTPGAGRRERVEQRAQHVVEARDRLLEATLRRLDTLGGRLPRPLGPTLRLTVGTIRKAVADRVGGLAAEAALFTLISLPALFLVVLGSLGYVSEVLGPRGEAQLDRLVLGLPRAVLTDTTYERYQEVARQVLDTGRIDIIGLGLLLGLWTGSRAMHRLLGTMTIAYDLHAHRSIWRQRLTAIWLTAVALVVTLIVLPTVVIGPRLARELLPGTDTVTMTLDVVDAAYWPVVALLGVAALTQVYQVGTPAARPWRRDLPGAALAVALCVAATLALLTYLRFTGVMSDREGLVYQQLGTPIAIVFWIWGSCIAVLVGAELNAQIERTWPSRPSRPSSSSRANR